MDISAHDGGGEPRQQVRRRRSADDPRGTTEKGAGKQGAGEPEEWLSDERVAVGELKRGAIAAQFPEEFSVDSDFLNGASNVWLPARLHPEIAPGEFQEWLRKHGSQLSKVEDTVNRRKSILSYSYDGTGSDSGEEAPVAVAIGLMAGTRVRRRNTTGLVRRKSFIERAAEEEQAADVAGDGATSFLVQNIQRTSLKRSKLANKRRDSTASTGSARRRGRGRGRSQAHDASAPAVSSPLAPVDPPEHGPVAAPAPALGTAGAPPNHAARPHAVSAAPSGRVPPGAAPGDADTTPAQRMSTVEILKQVTAAVDDISFDDFELCGLEPSDTDSGAAAAAVPRNQQPLPAVPPPAPAPAPAPATTERKTITHKKSTSWWQWGRDDSNGTTSNTSASGPSATGAQAELGNDWGSTAVAADGRPPRNGEQAQHQPGSQVDSSMSPSSSLKAKLPSSMSFLRFSRKGKKDRKAATDVGSGTNSQTPGPTRGAVPPVPAHSPALGLSPNQQKQSPHSRSQTPQQPQAQPTGQKSDADSDSDSSSDSESSLRLPPSLQPGSGAEGAAAAAAAGAQQQQQHSHIPSIITPVRPPPTRLATGSNRLPIHIERAIYRLGSIKLTNPRRPLLQQVLLSNMLFWYLELINPTTQQRQQQQQQHQPPPPSSPQQQQQAQPPQQPPQQQQQAHKSSPPHSQRSEQRQNYSRQQQPPPPPQQQQQPYQQQGDGGGSGRRGKRGGPLHKGREQDNRRRSAGTSGGEQVVMRSPQYERQQQQIYMNGGGAAQGYVYSQQSPPTSPQSMQFQQQQQQQQMPYQNTAGSRSQPLVARQSQSDEDDDVPLALYRGERNAMSIG
ncbi:hypothetical protein LPJ61_003733 [Coemansia biformis]|uniref:Protein Zds1 C-terminal domain-containing protein n=1 Tax=Coemansia biformis TaxID=1286918 RepID=A0A9W7YAU4_9FUNG|nr:hypothetical protein LPJ61_003733 [Coemansia biformis]